MKWKIGAAGAALLVLAAVAAAWPARAPDRLQAKLAAIRQPVPHSSVPCAALLAERPLRLLVLGQSNAANHGDAAAAGSSVAPVALLANGQCYRSRAPLPGATGEGGSVWPQLVQELQAAGGRPVLLSVVAVDGTSIADWTGPGALQRHLGEQLDAMRAAGMQPDLVLWQQGEADARDGTDQASYGAGLTQLRSLLAQHGVQAPLVAALSTYCPGSDGRAVRQALQAQAAAGLLQLGPDTDTLQGSLRNGCHFSADGLQAAAQLWAQHLQK